MNQPLRILHLRASNFVGGPEQQLLRYAELERDPRFEVVFGTFIGPGEGFEFRDAIQARGLGIVSLPSRNFGFNSALGALVSVLRQRKIALLCTHDYKSDILGTLAGRLTSVPVACFVRGWTAENWSVRLYEATDSSFLHLAERVVCLSESQARLLARRKRLSAKIRVVPNAVDLPSFDVERLVSARQNLRQRCGLPADCLVVAAAGRLSPEKGTAYLLKAAVQIRHEFPDARFIVFGDGALRRELEQMVVRLGLSGNVCFPGLVRQLRELLPGVDVLVNPSLSEEMPNIVLEGMAAGVPVVATAVGGVPEIAGSAETISLIPPAKPSSMALAIGKLLRDPARARQLAQAGRQRVEQAFSPARQKAQLHKLYEELAPLARPELSSVPQMNTPAATRDEPTAQQASKQADLPFISVVMPVRNEGAQLGAALKDLLKQQYPKDRYEILVVDGNSTDRTASAVERNALSSPVCLLRLDNPRQLSSAGRNVGLQNSRGDLIVFIDGHCRIPSPTLLLDTARLFYATGADCLCRPQPLTMSGNTWFQDVVAHVRATAFGHGLDSTIYASDLEGFIDPTSSGASYRRAVFDRIGTYDERFDACEDVEFNYRVLRAGLRSYISPCLAVQYKARETLRGLWKQMMRYGRGRLRFARKHPDALTFSQMVPAALLVWLLIGGIFSTLSHPVGQIALATLVAYLSFVLFFAVRLGVRYGWCHLLTAPAIYMVIHLGLGAGLLVETAKPLVDWLASWRKRLEAAQAPRAKGEADRRSEGTPPSELPAQPVD